MTLRQLIEKLKSEIPDEDRNKECAFTMVLIPDLIKLCEAAEVLYTGMKNECYRRMPCTACDTMKAADKIARGEHE